MVPVGFHTRIHQALAGVWPLFSSEIAVCRSRRDEPDAIPKIRLQMSPPGKLTPPRIIPSTYESDEASEQACLIHVPFLPAHEAALPYFGYSTFPAWTGSRAAGTILAHAGI